jgi:hypothetical protein
MTGWSSLSRQPTPGLRLVRFRLSADRRGCTLHWAEE